MIDRYTKIVLTVIALALCILVVRPYVEPGPAQAVGPVEVKIVGASYAALLYAGPMKVDCDDCKR